MRFDFGLAFDLDVKCDRSIVSRTSDRQEALFDAAKPQLLTTYPSEFVAFENGIVVDHDANEQTLAQRVCSQRPNQDLLIRQVLEQEPILMVCMSSTNAVSNLTVSPPEDYIQSCNPSELTTDGDKNDRLLTTHHAMTKTPPTNLSCDASPDNHPRCKSQ